MNVYIYNFLSYSGQPELLSKSIHSFFFGVFFPLAFFCQEEAGRAGARRLNIAQQTQTDNVCTENL